jgi:hypothetical protein
MTVEKRNRLKDEKAN